MEEKNELNDIILNKSTHNGNNKKLLLAVATLALILIIVVVIMNSLQSENTNNLPQAVLPPEPITQNDSLRDDPLFEPVEVIEEVSEEDNRLNEIAQKLKAESLQKSQQSAVIEEEEIVIVEAPVVVVKKKKPVVVKQPVVVKTHAKPVTQAKKPASKGSHYVQVGSFSKLKPSSTLIKKIHAQGYEYIYYNTTVNGRVINKVLIGPFATKEKSHEARTQIRRTIEPDAFIFKMR